MKKNIYVIFIFILSCNYKSSKNDIIDAKEDETVYCCDIPYETDIIDVKRDEVIYCCDMSYPEYDWGHSLDEDNEEIEETDEDFLPDFPNCSNALDGTATELIPVPPSRPPMPCGPNCRQVSFAESDVWSWTIGIWENKLVFSTGTTGYTPDITRIWLVDLDNLNQYIISESNVANVDQPISRNTDIFDNKIVWVYSVLIDLDRYISRNCIMLYDLTDLSLTNVWSMVFPSREPSDLRIYGNYLAWWDGRVIVPWGGQVFLFNIETAEERLLSPDECCASAVEMNGNWVVWEQGVPGSGTNIWVHDIERNESRPITSGRKDKWSPYVYDNKVVWAECFVEGCTHYDGLSADIMVMDLITGEVTRITNDLHLQTWPLLGDNIVLWTDCRNDPENSAECWNREIDIYMKDLTTQEERRVTDLPGDEGPDGIWGNKVYFLKRDLANILSVFELTL